MIDVTVCASTSTFAPSKVVFRVSRIYALRTMTTRDRLEGLANRSIIAVHHEPLLLRSDRLTHRGKPTVRRKLKHPTIPGQPLICSSWKEGETCSR